jgi:signal peptidase II
LSVVPAKAGTQFLIAAKSWIPAFAGMTKIFSMPPKPNALIWLALSALVIVLDQITKYFAIALLEPYKANAVIPGFLNWTLAYNEGAAFSFLHDAGGWQRWLFTALAIGVSCVLVVWLRRTARGEWRTALPLALVIGGALGNLIDRVRFGHVTDFIEVYHQQWSWPAFNVADSAISVGAVLLILLGLGGRKTPESTP